MSVESPPSQDREERKAASRRRILDSAREIFFRDGFMAANLDEIAQLSGVAKGTLYRYFDSKAELYVAMLVADGEAFERRMRETLDDGLSPPEQVRETGLFYFDHWSKNPEYFRIFWAVENQSVIGGLPEGVLERVAGLWNVCVRILAEVVEAGVRSGHFRDCDSWEVAYMLWTFANAVIQTESSATHRKLRRRPLREAFEDGLGLVLFGLAAPRRSA